MSKAVEKSIVEDEEVIENPIEELYIDSNIHS